jgi:hypothetical protein
VDYFFLSCLQPICAKKIQAAFDKLATLAKCRDKLVPMELDQK